MAHIKSLKPLTAKTDTYRNWVLYLFDVLKEYRQEGDILKAIKYELLKNNYQTFSEIRNEMFEELNADNAEQEEYNNLKALTVIEKLFINLNRYNEEFTLNKISEIFKALKIEWNKADFDKLKQISLIISANWSEFVSSWIKELSNGIEVDSSEDRKQIVISKFSLPLIVDSIKTRFDVTFTPSSKAIDLLDSGSNYTFKLRGVDKFKHSKNYIDALNSMHSGLINRGYIDKETHFSKTKRIFSGELLKLDDNQKIIWLKPDVQLHYFIDLFQEYLEIPASGIWNVTTNCFIKKGNKHFDSRRLGKAKIIEVKEINKIELKKFAQHIINFMP